ncbi:hypothetical protein [Undibacterium pigrum]|uniref:hypothetical protein n=1 Tax=Undibacterium pigrum TaxID=401470 RepID=UPI001475233F|nr:hypothetical protein [Undibacterium pigrum]
MAEKRWSLPGKQDGESASQGKKATDMSNLDIDDIILLTISNKQSIFQEKYTKR